MPHTFRMPDIGEGLTEAEIIKWFVSVGDTVEVDQILVEVETAKTVVEIPSPFAGTITAINVREGETVEVGAVLFVINGEPNTPPPPLLSPFEGGRQSEARAMQGDREAGGRQSEERATQGEDRLATPSGLEDSPVLPQGRTKNEQPTPSKSLSPFQGGRQSEERAMQGDSEAGGRQSQTRAMPIIRKLAKEKGVDLTLVEGSGPGGTITRADVENAAKPEEAQGLTPLTRVRKAIAHHMAESWRTIPHVTVQAEVRAENLLEARSLRAEKACPIETLVAAAVLPLLKRYREFNAEYVDGAIAYKSRFHLGFAVDTEAGLMVVVVKDAEKMSLEALTTEFERLAEAARDRTITPDEVTGQTFTISNIGALGGGHGTPIIPLGTSAIISIGRAKQQPVVEDDLLAVGIVAPLDLSYDHRLIDGSLGQRFLSDLITNLESPL